MTNTLVVIINSLQSVKNLRKKITIRNEISCTKLRLPPEPLTRGLPPPDPRSLCPLCSTEFVDPPGNKIPGYATARIRTFYSFPTLCCFGPCRKNTLSTVWPPLLPFSMPYIGMLIAARHLSHCAGCLLLEDSRRRRRMFLDKHIPRIT